MTEDDAKTKWCPMVHIRQTILINQAADKKQIDAAESANRQTKCIASGCMMWRESRVYWAKDGVEAKMPEYASYKTPEEGGFVTIKEGYCGLAGKP